MGINDSGPCLRVVYLTNGSTNDQPVVRCRKHLNDSWFVRKTKNDWQHTIHETTNRRQSSQPTSSKYPTSTVYEQQTLELRVNETHTMMKDKYGFRSRAKSGKQLSRGCIVWRKVHLEDFDLIMTFASDANSLFLKMTFNSMDVAGGWQIHNPHVA